MNAIDKRRYELFRRKDSPNWWMRFSIAGHGQNVDRPSPGDHTTFIVMPAYSR